MIHSTEYSFSYLLTATLAPHYSDVRLAKELAYKIETRDTTPSYMVDFYKTICGSVDALRAEQARRS